MISYAVALLFFLQLLTSFVAANYALGLSTNKLPPESVSAVFLLAPFLLTLRKRWPARLAIILFCVIAAARLGVPFIDDARAIVLVTGCGVGASMLLVPLLLMSRERNDAASSLTNGLALAVAAYIALRALGSGIDVSMSGSTSVVAWPLTALALWRWQRASGLLPEGEATASGVRVASLGLGMMAALTLIYFAFSAPNVIARWTGESYLMVTGMILGALLAWSALFPLRFMTGRMTGWASTAGTALSGLFLALMVGGHQVSFPPDGEAYPLPEPATPWWSTPVLIAALLLWPLILFAFHSMAGQLQALKPSARQLGLGFGLGAGFLSIAILAQILTTTYDYVALIGPVFRDRFWLVVATPAACLLTALLLVPAERLTPVRRDRGLSVGLAGLTLLTVGGAIYAHADPELPPPKDSLTVLTFNMQQGYSADLRRNFDGQLALLRRYDADIIGLSESDTDRVANGNDDLVRYCANELDLYSYFGPKTVTGTFGIALLSRYPIEDPQTFYLYSEGEQTAMIAAKVNVDGRIFDVMVTHLGNGGPLIQQKAVLEVASSLSNVILMGDFNFRPETEQYHLTVQQLEDVWAKRWPSGMEANGSTWPRRLDHVFVSPGMEVRNATFIDSRASDHPALVVQFGW